MHLNPTENRASGPTNPATQMAADAIAHLSEQQRMSLAISIVNDAEMRSSVAPLMRLAKLANTTACEIQAARMLDSMSEHSSIDPEFMRIVLAHYNRTDNPPLTMAYRHASLEASARKLACHVPSIDSVRHALKQHRCGKRVTA